MKVLNTIVTNMDPYSRHNIGRESNGGKAIPRYYFLAGRHLPATRYRLDYGSRSLVLHCCN
jgi:hypothetical protein